MTCVHLLKRTLEIVYNNFKRVIHLIKFYFLFLNNRKIAYV